MERLRLDERVAISFATHLTWADGVPSPPRPLPHRYLSTLTLDP